MEEEAGGGGERGPASVIIGRRITLLDQMSTAQDRRDQLAGLTLDAILFNKRPSPPPPASTSRTLLDIIRNEDPNGKSFGHKDKRSWNVFRDRLRLRRAGGAWTPSVRVPASDIPNQISSVNNSHRRSQLCRRTSVRFQTDPASDMRNQTEPPQYMSRPSSTDSPAHDEDFLPEGSSSRSSRPQLARYDSTRVPSWNSDSDDYNNADPFEVAREGTRCLAVALAQERQLSSRVAVVALESPEAQAEVAALVEAETSAIAAEASLQGVSSDAEAEAEPAQQQDEPPVRMSLMDLLEETDRQMGVEGSRYTVGGNDDEEEEEDEAEEEGGGDVAAEAGGIEHNCCVCMVRHKGAAFIPCGHTFCRLCSRELWVQRGSCPLCNGFILEILDIF